MLPSPGSMALRRLAYLGAAIATLAACGERFQAGLANAPSLERKSEPRQQYDAITGGDEGCKSRDGGPSVVSAAGGCKQSSGSTVIDAGGLEASTSLQLLH